MAGALTVAVIHLFSQPVKQCPGDVTGTVRAMGRRPMGVQGPDHRPSEVRPSPWNTTAEQILIGVSRTRPLGGLPEVRRAPGTSDQDDHPPRLTTNTEQITEQSFCSPAETIFTKLSEAFICAAYLPLSRSVNCVTTINHSFICTMALSLFPSRNMSGQCDA